MIHMPASLLSRKSWYQQDSLLTERNKVGRGFDDTFSLAMDSLLVGIHVPFRHDSSICCQHQKPGILVNASKL